MYILSTIYYNNIIERDNERRRTSKNFLRAYSSLGNGTGTATAKGLPNNFICNFIGIHRLTILHGHKIHKGKVLVPITPKN